MSRITIKNLIGRPLFEGEYPDVKAAVEAAVKSGVPLRGAMLDDCDLSGANLTNGQFQNATFAWAILRDAVIVSSDFEGARFSNADMTRLQARLCNFSQANLKYINATGATFAKCMFIDTDMSARAGTFDPEVSLGIEPPPGHTLAVARQILEDPTETLNMQSWHTCETMHCLAGWAVHLAGPTGYALEKLTSPSVAGSILAPEASHLFYDVAKGQGVVEWCRNYVQAHENTQELSVS